MNSKSLSSPLVNACNDFLDGNIGAKIIIHSNKADTEEVPVSYFFRSFDDMPVIEQKALSLCDGKILDIGAGVGSHSLHLQQNGFDVNSLEIEAGLVGIMKQRGIVNTYASDIYDFSECKFDTLLLMMNGIGITSDFLGLERFLEHAKTLLNKGGKIILDSSDLLYLYEEEDGSILLDLNEEYYGEVEYEFEYNGLNSKPFKWLFVDFNNLEFFAQQAGFEAEMIMEGEHFNYLAQLNLIS